MGRVRRGAFPVRVAPGAGGLRRVGYAAIRPRGARALLVLAHGAGAGMDHPFLASLADALARRGIASFRYQFPYSERGLRRPDPRGVLLATVRAAVAEARRRVRGLPVFAGGKSMGGRMTSLLASEGALPGVVGLVFVGFPLHPADRPGSERGRHLARVQCPMLFLQGGRDALAGRSRVRRLCRSLGSRARLHEIDDADHAFHVPKRTGRTDEEVVEELAARIARFTETMAKVETAGRARR